MGSVDVCMLKYRVKTTGTDKRHVVSFSNVRFSKVPLDSMFHDHDTAERHWYSCRRTLSEVCVVTFSQLGLFFTLTFLQEIRLYKIRWDSDLY